MMAATSVCVLRILQHKRCVSVSHGKCVDHYKTQHGVILDSVQESWMEG